MSLFLSRYLKALIAVITAMVIYFVTVVPWIEPRHRASYPLPEFTGLASSQRWWEPIFQASDWQNQQPTVVQNSRGVLLARSWEQVDPQTWRLNPLTIVLSQVDAEAMLDGGAESASEVWVISAQGGATIHFDSPLDLNSGRVPSIQRGYLEGDIRISRVSLDAPNKPTLQLQTSNVTIDRRQIWTHDDVLVDSSNLWIRGRMLRIHLFGDILSKQSISIDQESTPRIGPVEEVELVHLNELKMRLEPGGIWSGVDPKMLQVPGPVPLTQRPAFVSAQCGGRFSLNLSKEQASLNGGVNLKHHVEGLPPDEFQCHRVHVQFQSEQKRPSNADAENRPLINNLQLRAIEAFGVDSLEGLVGETWVELKSPTVGGTVRAKRLRYDFQKQRIELNGQLPQPGATVSVAELNYLGHHFRAPSIEYQAAPKGADGRPLHGGWMVAQGAGEVSTSADTPLGEVQIRWEDRFQFAPADNAGEQWIEIVGRTLVESKQRGFLTSERLQLWLGSGTGSANAERTALPQRLVSLGPTRIASGAVGMDVSSLDLNFVYPNLGSDPTDDDLALQDSTGGSMFQFLNPPDGTPKGSSMDGLFGIAGQTDGGQLAIEGKALRATIASVDGPMWVDAMTLHGPLSIKSSGGSMPVEIRGNSLTLTTTSRNELDLEIEGSPALVHIADGAMEGPRIRFDQRQNQLWMDQPGQCTLPASVIRRVNPAGSLHWEMPLRCAWQGRMLFDGQMVQFDGGVRLSGAVGRNDGLWLIDGLCQSMEIQLAQAIHFGQLGSDTHQAASVDQIRLRDQVDLRVAQRDTTGQRVSLQRLQVPAMTVFVPQEKIVAYGPGQGIAKFVAGRSLGTLAASSPEPNGGQLQCADLRFRDSLVALLDRNEIIADGSVNVVTTPITNWDETPDTYAITKLLPGQMSIASDQIKLYDTSTMNSTQAMRLNASDSLAGPFWEVQATGNVLFEGNTDSGEYSGNGYQVSYVESKSLLTLRGDGRTKAILRRSPSASQVSISQAGSANNFPTVIQVPLATFNVRTMAVDVPEGGLDLQVDFPNQTGTIQPNGSVHSPRPGDPTTPSTPNPRDGIKNFLRGY